MVAYPEVQRLVREEIDKVLAADCPTLEDRKRMPYMQVIKSIDIKIID